MALVLLRLFLNPHKKKEKYTATNTNTFLTREAKRGENRCKFNRRKDRKAYVKVTPHLFTHSFTRFFFSSISFTLKHNSSDKRDTAMAQGVPQEEETISRSRLTTTWSSGEYRTGFPWEVG